MQKVLFCTFKHRYNGMKDYRSRRIKKLKWLKRRKSVKTMVVIIVKEIMTLEKSVELVE
jgi:hypothetical protein